MVEDSEAKLLAGCRRGDLEAWDALFERYYPAAGRFLAHLGAFTAEDIEELCQEVFLSVITHLDQFNGQSQFQTWLFRIAANKARDWREKQHAAKRGGGQAPLSLQAEDPETGLAPDPPSTERAPDSALLDAEQAELVHLALERLGEPCRELIQLRYFADLSYQELSAALSLNVKTVSSRLSKCLDRLEQIAREVFSGANSTVFPSNK